MDKQTRGSVALPNAFQAVWKTARQPWAAKILRQGGMAGMGYLLAGVELLEGAHPLGLAWGAAFCGQGQGAGALVGALLGYGALGSRGCPIARRCWCAPPALWYSPGSKWRAAGCLCPFARSSPCCAREAPP